MMNTAVAFRTWNRKMKKLGKLLLNYIMKRITQRTYVMHLYVLDAIVFDNINKPITCIINLKKVLKKICREL